MSRHRPVYHISSAVVFTMPAHTQSVLAALTDMENVEVHGHGAGKIVVVIEGPNTGFLGQRLTTISLLDGVVAATMVFEHVEVEEMQDHDWRPDAA